MEQLATLANLSRKTLYRWVKGEVAQPRHWYQIVALGKALRLSVDEVNQLLWITKYPSFQELKELACYEYELELLEEFSTIEPISSPIPRPRVRFEPWAALEAPTGAMRPESPFYIERVADSQLRRQLSGQGTTTTIQAGRQTGKTSLLINAIYASRHEQSKVIYVDFQLVDATSLDDLTSFLRFLSEAIDEADMLLDAGYKKHFFALLRAWDSRRAFDALAATIRHSRAMAITLQYLDHLVIQEYPLVYEILWVETSMVVTDSPQLRFLVLDRVIIPYRLM